ncbi:four-carbon acid sugar kinase family protein [Ciceribacter ferrooxidans]|uniref:Four-carbon acid sugar kinase family protein n=1 Tax=Ciceribacter ferrooxidans TaxID=2509717 RepID=A0A4Q2TA27_9HYPH|nr:four-carbon acid sugar kinase family protein [Ciceribacter ferrooxidans]RYC13984.1 four-carbon acid sugar kinase family protein [Ciceribacter ferrooxidans]
MTLKIAILADDLTGALDTGTPFVARGLSVTVALDSRHLADARNCETDVLVVNTASRALTEMEAAERIREAAIAIAPLAPRIVMKKIDSRLKGNVAVECEALADVFGRTFMVIAPAIPDQQRFTKAGMVVGRGVDTPLSIGAVFGRTALPLTIADAASDADLDGIVRAHDWMTTLAVGARGVGAALARLLGHEREQKSTLFVPTGRTLFAFGSRDPITAAQIVRLEESRWLRHVGDAPMGEIMDDPASIALPALFRCTGAIEADGAGVARRFAAGLQSVIDRTKPDMLMLGGGDTALAVLDRLGIELVRPQGEIEPGIPWFEVTGTDGRTFRCAVKSGGFGTADSLLALVAESSRVPHLNEETSIG